MLTVDGLRTLVAAATGGRETDVAGYIATLVKRGVLADNAPLNARALAVVLLSFLSGLPPVKAASEGSRLTEFRLRGTSERRDQAGGAAVMWSDLRETGETLGEILTSIISGMRAGTWAALIPIYQLRHVRSPSIDVVEGFYRDADEAAILGGVSFSPASPPSPAPSSALSRLVETTLSWLTVEHLARELGRSAPDEGPDAVMVASR